MRTTRPRKWPIRSHSVERRDTQLEEDLEKGASAFHRGLLAMYGHPCVATRIYACEHVCISGRQAPSLEEKALPAHLRVHYICIDDVQSLFKQMSGGTPPATNPLPWALKGVVQFFVYTLSHLQPSVDHIPVPTTFVWHSLTSHRGCFHVVRALNQQSPLALVKPVAGGHARRTIRRCPAHHCHREDLLCPLVSGMCVCPDNLRYFRCLSTASHQ